MGVCKFHRYTSGFWVSLAGKVPYVCFMKFGCKILRYLWNYRTDQLWDYFFDQKNPKDLLSYCITPLLQWHSATSVERKECCFPHLFKRKHNGLLILRGSAFPWSAVITLQCLMTVCERFSSGSLIFNFYCFNQA